MPRPTSDFEKTLPTEIAYADDVDFIGLEFADISEVQKTLKKYNILVNADKTEQTTLSRLGKEYKYAKKVGTLSDRRRRRHLGLDKNRRRKTKCISSPTIEENT